MGIASSLQSLSHVTDPFRSYWSARLSSGKEVNEQGLVWDFRAGGLRPIDWSLDVVTTGDIYRIQDISLHCPDGQVAWFRIEEPGTVFQLKIATISILSGHRQVQAHLIGKVVDKDTGACICKIWDLESGLITFESYVGNNPDYGGFQSWRPGILPMGKLSLDVLGLRL